MSCDAELAEQ